MFICGIKSLRVSDSVEYLPRVIADRPSVLVTELGNVLTLVLPNLVVQIRQKAQNFTLAGQ
jgi:hypothetical protein